MTDDKCSELEKQLIATQNLYAKVLEEQEALQGYCSQLEEQIALQGDDARTLLARLITLHTSVNKKRSWKNDDDFNTWQNGIESVLKERCRKLERERDELRREYFKTKMDLIIKTHPDLAEVPFGYCDINRQLICTPAVYDAFGVERGKELDLGDLFRNIRREHRRFIFEAFKSGVRLKDYKLREGLAINSYPLFYDKLPVGIGFFLIDSGKSLEEGKLYRFSRAVLTEVRKVSEEYGVLREKIQKSG